MRLDEGLLDGVLCIPVGREQVCGANGDGLGAAGRAPRRPRRRLSVRDRSARRRHAMGLPSDGPPWSTVVRTHRWPRTGSEAGVSRRRPGRSGDRTIAADDRSRLPTILDPELPVAVEAFGSTIRDSTGREYLDAAGGAIVVNVGHGRESIARVLGEQAARLSYAHGSAFTTEPLEAYATEVGTIPARRGSRDLPGQRRLRGDRDGAEARPRLPRRSRRAEPVVGLCPLGELPREHDRGPRPVRPSPAPTPVRGLARPVPTRVGRLSVSRQRSGQPGPRERR